MDIQEKEALIAEIEKFKESSMQLYFVQNWVDSYKTNPFSYSINDDGSVFWLKAQARQLWDFWQATKAQSVPAEFEIGRLKDQITELLDERQDLYVQINAQAVLEGFGLFDGDTLTYSNGYSINCSFDDEFDCHVFDVSKDGCYIKTGMTQLEQAHCLVLSMIKLDSKDSTLEAQEQAND